MKNKALSIVGTILALCFGIGITAIVFTGCGKNPGHIRNADRDDSLRQTQSSSGAALIGEDKAKEIALERAGLTANDVTFKRTELDRDDGVVRYEIEFRKDRTEYDVEVHAYDGRILSFEKDIDD